MWIDPSGYVAHPNKNSNTHQKKFEKWLNKGKNNTAVYKGMDHGAYTYNGITRQDLQLRLNQHNYNFKKDNNVDFDRFTSLDKITDGLTWNQARSVEQLLIEANKRTNRINSISLNNKFKKEADEWARTYLKSINLNINDFK